MTSLPLTIYKKNGLHVRLAAAFITKLQSLLQNKELLKKTYVVYNNKKVQVNNLLSLVSLKIGRGEEFQLVFEQAVPPGILEEIKDFFEKNELVDSGQAEADRLMMENSMTLQEAIAALPNGIIVVNKENVITYANDVAAKLLNKAPQELINHRADQVIPSSRLHVVIETNKPELGEKQIINNTPLLTNRSPVMFDGQMIGAVAVFQDISNLEKVSRELTNVRELQQRLDLVLQSVSDLIGLTDQEGTFIYANEEMTGMFQKQRKRKTIQAVIGTSAWKALAVEPQPFMKMVRIAPQAKYITKINPLVVDGEFKGTVVTMSPYDEMKLLLQKIELMEQRTKYLEFELSKYQKLNDAFKTIKGSSKVLLDSLTMADKVAKTESTVMITGESGTGKELVARAVHEASSRKEKPFIRVNCAAIHPNLMESELFGHEKGAFTGAYTTHRGKFELANNGTIFLDEIGDLNFELQAKILRVLQEKEVDRVGGTRPLKLDVRIIAATNRNLTKMVDEGTFREDLYYRLHVIPIHLPPLRSRIDDIPYLVDHFTEQLNNKLGKNINGYEASFIERLCHYHWPGNIRELQNIIERVFHLTESHLLCSKDLPPHIFYGTKEQASKPAGPFAEWLTSKHVLKLEDYEKQIFAHACQLYPSYNQLAQALGITHKTAAKKLRKYGLERMLGKKYQQAAIFSQPPSLNE
ncbi:TyrR family helix-turn-helix domain-containing protein [Evansella caseinilytica]|uniref:HTH-type transcriptional regulatory protein TyrR n=1 Tax=Evansella caseinilytica TaxID=1503961 RepID=A0A1H3IGU8_9BACI|nr:sigma 54-interacting transcriptional regulator [Evansella caseinilytica]SDY26930.1 TyrR family helix-turn-helix domain-containing protein [Evansella caseinilytica]